MVYIPYIYVLINNIYYITRYVAAVHGGSVRKDLAGLVRCLNPTEARFICLYQYQSQLLSAVLLDKFKWSSSDSNNKTVLHRAWALQTSPISKVWISHCIAGSIWMDEECGNDCILKGLRNMFITLVWNDQQSFYRHHDYNYNSHSFLCVSHFNLLLHY